MPRSPKANGGVGHNKPPVLVEIHGNCAAHVCKVCSGCYIVSAYIDKQHQAHTQGWRVCPHCNGTEATIWWSGYHARSDLGKYKQEAYETSQRKLQTREMEEAAASKPTKIGQQLRLRHERGKRLGPIRW